ncbi:hypothetical protein KFK14_21845 [Sphingobium phenoxybenzoativorans]|uniref:Uncharacterized protein n=1 Tax=Sphingobium phenoxybenzoativorans TaxID=1592790 RepID=A0A975K726_9SPHN|nr:hypothetical protein KFK14_21845 [Sphingobium phenoxybenzoativorans]
MATEAERMHRERQEDQRQILDLELQQARYEDNLAERRYAACDSDIRLIAAQLEKNWKIALQRFRKLQARRPTENLATIEVHPGAFANMAENLSAAWNASDVTMHARQQMLRALIADIIVDVDDEVRDVVLTIHWRGGQHSKLRVRKQQAGEQAIVERQQSVPPERDNHRLLDFGHSCRMRGLRPGLQILDRRPLAPLHHRLGIDAQLPAQRRERSLRSLYCCSDGVRGRGAPVTYLSHSASFHSNERITSSNRGIKHLAAVCHRSAVPRAEKAKDDSTPKSTKLRRNDLGAR